MFKANRVGTPYIHTITSVTSTTTPITNTVANSSAAAVMNVINASPVTDFGRSTVHWTGSNVIAAGGNKWGVGQQFTVQAPLTGDTVGLELMFGIVFNAPPSVLIVPTFGKLAAAGASVMAPVSFTDQPTLFGPTTPGSDTGDTNKLRVWTYKEQFIINEDDPAVIAGTYCHGIQIFDSDAAGYTNSYIRAAISVRQFNDLQQVSYRDPLR